MKKLAKLAIFFSLTFIIIFAAATGIRFLSLRVDWAKSLPAKPETTLTLILAAAHWALSLSLFASILTAMNYTVRRLVNPAIAAACVIVLSFIFSFGISLALQQWQAVPPAKVSGVNLGGRGLILSNASSRSETAIVLLNGTLEPLGPRITSLPGEPLTYQRAAGGNFDLPSVPFRNDTPWFLESIAKDIRLNAETFRNKFTEGFFSYLIYAGSLIFLLCSLGYASKFSVWPLANLFIATLAFRGILAFNTFFNTPEMQIITSAFLNNKLPVALALPLMFLGFGILLNVYSFLVFAAKRRSDDEL